MWSAVSWIRGTRTVAALAGIWAGGIANATILDPPAPRCATVNAGADVTVSWTPPNDPNGDCAQLELWHASAPEGPFALLTTLACGATSYFHAGAGAGALHA